VNGTSRGVDVDVMRSDDIERFSSYDRRANGARDGREIEPGAEAVRNVVPTCGFGRSTG
jgi:hypothetical protein